MTGVIRLARRMFDCNLKQMKISEHADRSEKLVGVRAEDIHKWIDGFFDREGFRYFLGAKNPGSFSPYNHRKYRHCAEALEDAYREF